MKKIPIKIGPKVKDINDPWVDDVLNRKMCAKILDDIILSTDEPITIFVDGEWGSGKTFFLTRWQSQLEGMGCKVIMFNAWQDDDVCDPLVALIGQLHKNLHREPKYKKSYNAMIRGAKRMLIGILEESSCIVEHRTGMNPTRAVRRVGSRLERVIENYASAAEQKIIFKERLQGLAESVYENTGRPLVFIIDELDRSRPIFAVDVLERVKHYFDIPHIVFVLGVDETQLQKTIEAAYGAIDARSYLHRFMDYEFHLPSPCRTEYANMLWSDYGIEKAFSNIKKRSALLMSIRNAKVLFTSLCALHEMTLREMDSAFKVFVLMLRSFKEDTGRPYELIAALVVLKVIRPDVCMAWLQGEMQVYEVVDALLPMDTILNFDHLDDLIAAIYATHYKEVSVIAKNANTFIRKVTESEIDGAEFRNPIPVCMRKMKSKDLKNIASKVQKLHDDVDGHCLYSFKNLVRLGSKFDFLLHALQVRNGMHNDISHIKQGYKACDAERLVIGVEAFPVSIRHV